MGSWQARRSAIFIAMNCCGKGYAGVGCLKLVAEGEILQGGLSAGLDGGRERENNDIEHPIMLYSAGRNRHGDKADGIFDTGDGSILK